MVNLYVKVLNGKYAFLLKNDKTKIWPLLKAGYLFEI